MKKSLLLSFAACFAMIFIVSCDNKDDVDPEDQTVETSLSNFRITEPISVSGNVDLNAGTISLDYPADANISAATIEFDLEEGAIANPSPGSSVDLASGDLEIIVTGKDENGAEVTKTYIVMSSPTAVIGFVGRAATIAELEDDALAAATWLSEQYGDQFTYLGAAAITPESIANLKVMFYYELEPVAGEETINLGVMEDVAGTVSNWVRDGGNLFLAGDAAEFIYSIERVPESNYYWTEICCSGVEFDKAADDIWGMGANPGTTSEDRTDHPIFEGLLDSDGNVILTNAPTREVRLFWWNVGPAGGECCVNLEMVTNFENQLKATKLSSLRGIGDYFGFNAIEFGRTDLETDASLNADVPQDFRGTVIMFSNTINGYEWNVNDGGVNEYAANIEGITKNTIDYLKSEFDNR